MMATPVLTPRQRAEQLLREIREEGWEMEFVEQGPRGRVHVVGPDSDQPGYADVVESLMIRKFRVLCGQVVRKNPLDGTLVDTFDDRRLCWGCHAAFPTFDDQALIFQFNTESAPSSGLWAPGKNESIRAGRRIAADREEAAAAAAGGGS